MKQKQPRPYGRGCFYAVFARSADAELFADVVFHADQRFDLFLRGVVQPMRIGAAAVGGHGDADELMIVFAAHRVAGALDHAREGQKIVRVLHLFGVGVLVRDAVLVNVGVEVCHDAAVAAGAVAVAVMGVPLAASSRRRISS